MSAFIVGNKHVNAMLQVAERSGYPGSRLSYYWDEDLHYFNGQLETIGQKLVDENYRSVNYRYSEDEQSERFELVLMHRDFTPVEIIKACDCYNYQSCETPDWKETEAYAIVQALRERAIDLLPGYEEATYNIV